MKKRLLFLIALFAASMFVMAEMTVYVHKKDGTKVPYVAATVDSIGFVNIFTISFDANGGDGFMDAIQVKEGETITLPTNEIVNYKADFNGWNTKIDGTGLYYADKSNMTPEGDITLYAQWINIKTEGEENGHEWVDLGLPSGTLWATTNVGASKPEGYGDYCQYGAYSSSTVLERYKWYNTEYKMYTKYCGEDGRNVLEMIDDYASTEWGGGWRTPTRKEFEELINNSIVEWIRLNGTDGYRFSSKINGNSIFLPAAGSKEDDYNSYIGKTGRYRTSVLFDGPLEMRLLNERDDSSYYLSFSSTSYKLVLGYRDRYYGFTIRPVIGKNTHKVTFNKNIGEEDIDTFQVGHTEGIKADVKRYTQDGYDFCGWNTRPDGNGFYVDPSDIMYIHQDTTLYAQWCRKIVEDKDNYVDLGLSSGVLWASCTLGAEKPEDRGCFYAWGEVDSKAIYNQDTYKWKIIVFAANQNRCLYNKYCSINSTLPDAVGNDGRWVLENTDDAANFNCGEKWRMPTQNEFEELRNSCLWQWTTINGVNGYIVTSKKNGNSIFLPASGARTDNFLIDNNEYGWYYSSVRGSNQPYVLKFSAQEINVVVQDRFNGYNIRPVRVK